MCLGRVCNICAADFSPKFMPAYAHGHHVPSKATAPVKAVRGHLPSAKHHLIGTGGFSEKEAEGFLWAAQSTAVDVGANKTMQTWPRLSADGQYGACLAPTAGRVDEALRGYFRCAFLWEVFNRDTRIRCKPNAIYPLETRENVFSRCFA